MSNTKTRTVYYGAQYVVENTDPQFAFGTNPIAKRRMFTLTRTRTGSGVPHYKDLIRNHSSATSELNATKDEIYVRGGAGATLLYHRDATLGFDKRAPTRKQKISGDWITTKLQVPQMKFNWPSNADGKARNKFLSEVRKEQTHVSGLTFLGELKPTLAMIRRPAGALWDNIGRYYRALRKRKRADPTGWASAIHGVWLEYSYGWRPLMMDIAGGFDALNSLLEKNDYTTTVTGSAMASWAIQDGMTGAAYDTEVPYVWYNLGYSEREHEIIRYRGGVYTRAATTFEDRAARWGFTPSDYVPTLWELLPWSFLVDYFATIGDCLDATYANQSNVVWLCKTIIHKGRYTIMGGLDLGQTSKGWPKDSFIAATGESGLAFYERRTVHRMDFTGVLLTPQVNILYEGPKWGQIANMSALFGQFCSNLHTQTPAKHNYRW